MMRLEQLVDYCMAFPEVTQDFPFDKYTMVFRLQGKMFAVVNVKKWSEGTEWINVKCDPQYALELREQYASIIPGYHMNKRHWNTLIVDEGELSLEQIFDYIHHSYELINAQISKNTVKS